MTRKRRRIAEDGRLLASFLTQAQGYDHDYKKLMALKKRLSPGLRKEAAKSLMRKGIAEAPVKPEYGDAIGGLNICPLHSKLYMFSGKEFNAALNELIFTSEAQIRYDRGVVGIRLTTKGRKKADR